jgi:hypothetical protein
MQPKNQQDLVAYKGEKNMHYMFELFRCYDSRLRITYCMPDLYWMINLETGEVISRDKDGYKENKVVLKLIRDKDKSTCLNFGCDGMEECGTLGEDDSTFQPLVGNIAGLSITDEQSHEDSEDDIVAPPKGTGDTENGPGDTEDKRKIAVKDTTVSAVAPKELPSGPELRIEFVNSFFPAAADP